MTSFLRSKSNSWFAGNSHVPAAKQDRTKTCTFDAIDSRILAIAGLTQFSNATCSACFFFTSGDVESNDNLDIRATLSAVTPDEFDVLFRFGDGDTTGTTVLSLGSAPGSSPELDLTFLHVSSNPTVQLNITAASGTTQLQVSTNQTDGEVFATYRVTYDGVDTFELFEDGVSRGTLVNANWDTLGGSVIAITSSGVTGGKPGFQSASVTENSVIVHDWDFGQSLLDSVGSAHFSREPGSDPILFVECDKADPTAPTSRSISDADANEGPPGAALALDTTGSAVGDLAILTHHTNLETGLPPAEPSPDLEWITLPEFQTFATTGYDIQNFLGLMRSSAVTTINPDNDNDNNIAAVALIEGVNFDNTPVIASTSIQDDGNSSLEIPADGGTELVTLFPNTMVVIVGSHGADLIGADPYVLNVAAPGLDSLTREVALDSAVGGGGGIVIYTGIKTEPGPIGSITLTGQNIEVGLAVYLLRSADDNPPTLPWMFEGDQMNSFGQWLNAETW